MNALGIFFTTQATVLK